MQQFSAEALSLGVLEQPQGLSLVGLTESGHGQSQPASMGGW